MKFERARTKEQINQRKDEIIDACAKLFDKHGYEGVHLKAISEITSFSRSTIYLYYKTKDEILLELFLKDIVKWDNKIKSMMAENETMSKDDFCKEVTKIFTESDRLMRLFSILYSSVENNCSVEELAKFKSKMSKSASTYYKCIYKYFPNSTNQEKNTFHMASISMVLGLYPSTHLTEKQTKAVELSGITFKCVDFKDAFYNCMLMLCSGMK